MYGERLLEHFQNPRNVGDLGAPAVTVEVSNPACGDAMRLSAKLEGGRVVEVRHRTYGCTAAIATGSVLTEWMVGKSTAELRELDTRTVDDAIGGLPKESRHAAVLCVDAVRALSRAQPANC